MSRVRTASRLFPSPVLLIVCVLVALLLAVPRAASASTGHAGPYPGVRERGDLLGRPSAPVKIVLFADLKCPACAQFEHGALPTVVRRLVRTGRASIELRLVNIIDSGAGTTDGALLRTTAQNLAAQDRMWSFAREVLRNQPPEDEEWATPERLAPFAAAVGARFGPATTKATAASRRAARRNDALFTRLGGTGTPSVFVRPRGRARYTAAQADTKDITAAVRRVERRRTR